MGTETMKRTKQVRCGRYVYKSRGSLDGRGGIELSYNDENNGCWEIGGPSSGCLYRLEAKCVTPEGILGDRIWTRSYGGDIHIIICVSVATDNGGWIDPALLCFDRSYRF